MANEKIKLSIGGEYTAKDAFNQMNGDVKSAQKEAKDFTQSFGGGISKIAGMVDGELNTSLSKFSDVLRGLGSGGLFGLVSVAATTAIGFVVQKFKEAQEAAVKFAEICKTEIVDAINKATGKFKDVSTEIANAKADANEMLNVLNGATATSANAQVHALHIQTLQKITDDMTQAAKNAILADEAYQAAIIKGTAAVEQAEATTKAAKNTVELMTQKREAAETALVEVQNKRKELENQMADYGRGWLAEKQKIEENIAKNEWAYNEGLYDQATYLKYNKDLKVQLSKVEEEHKDELAKLNEVKKIEADATAAVEAAKREEESATRAVTLAQQKEVETKNTYAQAEADVTEKLRQAEALLDKENIAKQKKIEEEELARYEAQERLDILEASNRAERTSLALNIDKNYLLNMFKDYLADGLDKQEAYNKITERINEIMDGRTKIEEVCAKYGIESAELQGLFNESMYNGNSVTETYAALQEKLNDTLKKRNDAEESAVDAASDSTSTGKDKKRGMLVHVDVGNLASGIEKGTKDNRSAYQKMKDDIKAEQKASKEELKKIKGESVHMIEFMKGRMPEAQAQKYKEYLAATYKPETLNKAGQTIISSQLINSKEQKEQTTKLSELVTIAKNLGLK